MTYPMPEITAYPSALLTELTGPVETQYITDLDVPDRIPGSQAGAQLEFCFDYVSEGCEGGDIQWRLLRPEKMEPTASELQQRYPAKEGQNCVSFMMYGCGPYELEVWVECDGKKTNVLSDRFYIDCDDA